MHTYLYDNMHNIHIVPFADHRGEELSSAVSALSPVSYYFTFWQMSGSGQPCIRRASEHRSSSGRSSSHENLQQIAEHKNKISTISLHISFPLCICPSYLAIHLSSFPVFSLVLPLYVISGTDI